MVGFLLLLFQQRVCFLLVAVVPEEDECYTNKDSQPGEQTVNTKAVCPGLFFGLLSLLPLLLIKVDVLKKLRLFYTEQTVIYFYNFILIAHNAVAVLFQREILCVNYI